MQSFDRIGPQLELIGPCLARLHEVQGVANQTPKTHLLLIQPTRTATTAGSKTSNLGSSVISIETTRKPRFLR